MKKILLLTKTSWNEAPRIRHQIAFLLKKRGFEVHFVEKNSYQSVLIKKREEDGIYFYSHSEFIHHQLRYNSILQALNNRVIVYYLRRIFRKTEFDYVINFNYDYSFLRQFFPNSQLISFINDDFESMAKIGMRKQISKQLEKTCKSSDKVITVSYPLLSKLLPFNKKTSILFPWASNKYKLPKKGYDRNVILYFGYVGRLDWEVIDDLVKQTNYKFRFIGPVSGKLEKQKIIELSQNFSRFQYIPFVDIDKLNVNDVFCSILPYDVNIESNQACSISNRALNLLSLGIPLVYANLNNLLEAPETILRKNGNFKDYVESLNFFFDNFNSVQPEIEGFLENHYELNRWKQLEEIFKKV